MGADTQVDDMVQFAALQGRDGNDDAVDAVAIAQLRDILQRALHRHPMDGLALRGRHQPPPQHARIPYWTCTR